LISKFETGYVPRDPDPQHCREECQLHIEDKGGICPVCMQRFPSARAIKEHMNKAHNNKDKDVAVVSGEDSNGSEQSDLVEILSS
jgi:hypothetical protein